MNSNTSIFRPKARIIRTLGDKLIKDSYAAVIELVKNSYDADAKKVEIIFDYLSNTKISKITVSDKGHGMDYDTVINKWMIPGTEDKKNRRYSPGGRRMLGNKGIGRLAASKLGNITTLNTTKDGATTTLIIDWKLFENDSYLDEIEFLIDQNISNESNGTKITIEEVGDDDWNEDKIRELKKELRKLVSPFHEKKDTFDIYLCFSNCGINEIEGESRLIEPFPVLEHFDYRLFGNIDKNGNGILTFINGIDKRIKDIQIKYDNPQLSIFSNKTCGTIKIDLRVFDRDPESIDDLIIRSKLKTEDGKYLGKNEARNLLNELSGVGIYREGFRIRPHGDPGYDWLELDKRRVQNPSMRTGSNQISGHIVIEDEQNSNLQEKSSREGLIEDIYYYILKERVSSALAELETRRFTFRQKIGRGRKTPKISQTLESLFDFTSLENQIDGMHEKGEIDEKATTSLKESISKEKKEKENKYEEILDVIARYEGQVTLGKIMGVVMHEGRKPVKYFIDTTPRINRWDECLKKKNVFFDDCIFSSEAISSDLEIYNKDALLLKDLFDRLEPLAGRKRQLPKQTRIKNIINRVIKLFSTEFERNDIKVKKKIEDIELYCVEDDIYIALTNLIDNSIYWLKDKDGEKILKIFAFSEDNSIMIDIIDNGPGIKEEFIEKIFEPNFSTKPTGTGLGLAIAGEEISRNNGELKLFDYKNGAYFRIELPNRSL